MPLDEHGCLAPLPRKNAAIKRIKEYEIEIERLRGDAVNRDKDIHDMATEIERLMAECLQLRNGAEHAELRAEIERLRKMMDWADRAEPGIARRAEIAICGF